MRSRKRGQSSNRGCGKGGGLGRHTKGKKTDGGSENIDLEMVANSYHLLCQNSQSQYYHPYA